MTTVDTSALKRAQQVLSAELQSAYECLAASKTETGRIRLRLVSQWRHHLDRAARIASECVLAEHAMNDPCSVEVRQDGQSGSFCLAKSIYPAVPARREGRIWISPHWALYQEVRDE